MTNNLGKAKQKTGRNRTISLDEGEAARLSKKLIKVNQKVDIDAITNKTICQNLFEVVDKLPNKFVDLLFIDPPYNLSKEFNGNKFKKMADEAYERWVDSWLAPLLKTLKPTASVYICGDWISSSAVYRAMAKYFIIRNRISWEREKGRGAKSNWKNCSEDIWFGTVSNDYYFNPNAVKLKRRVLAPYKAEGKPKDWVNDIDGNYRLTHPSNLWSDITVPFWSMSENTNHPTQKPEKLVAKIILASSKEKGFIFDPFLGVGTTSVVAKKLNRKYCGIEINEEYAYLAEKRLEMANKNKTIQGYTHGVFWERNSLSEQINKKTKASLGNQQKVIYGK